MTGEPGTGVTTVTLADGCLAGVTERALADPRDGYDGNLASHVGDDPQAVADNRERLRRRLAARRLVFVRQVHGRDVAVVDESGPAGVVELDLAADALVTTAPDTALAVVVADCLPVMLADPVAGVVAAAHAGRPGLAAGVLLATLQVMGDLGARPDRTVALIGPGVCGGCYEVPPAMRTEVAAGLPGAAATTRWGTPALDLPAAAVRQLGDAGVTVRRDPRCTLETAELFSHRRDGRDRPTGRFAGWVMRR